MKHAYLIRHAEKDDDGTLTEKGREEAVKLASQLPDFAIIISSESPRTRETAKLLTNLDSVVDPRAGFYMAPKEKSDAINRLANEKDISFLEAAVIFNDQEVNVGIENKASELSSLVSETINQLHENQSALIVSHDLSISPAMRQKGIPLESIPFLSGYTIDDNFGIERFNR